MNPRNLTLWINETGQLDMAIAYLSQSTINYGQELVESWECRNPQETDLGMKLVFSQNSAYSSGADFDASNQDILLINRSSQFLISKFILVIVFVIFMTMN